MLPQPAMPDGSDDEPNFGVFTQHIIGVYFFYGLAFFTMGLALILTDRQTSAFPFARAIRPLALFGLLHGAHEWYEMFQKMAEASSGHIPSGPEELLRIILLALSFAMLLTFGELLLGSAQPKSWQRFRLLIGLGGALGLSLVVTTYLNRPTLEEGLIQADILIRYLLGMPGALLGSWALLTQQRVFREHHMSQFGRDLVWCAAALLLYGLVGQCFVRPGQFFPANMINSSLFLAWFGIPVQLFRGVMATFLAIYMVRALRAFEVENRQQIQAAHETTLEAEHQMLQATARLNEDLRQTARELALLLDLSNLLASPIGLGDRLQAVLETVVERLQFPDAGLIRLRTDQRGPTDETVVVGLTAADHDQRYASAVNLAEQCLAAGIALCRHLDGQVIEFVLTDALVHQDCHRHQSPTLMIALPLNAQQQSIGSLVLTQPLEMAQPISYEEFRLMMGIAQQLGLSIEHARLYQLVREREKRLADLLRQVVSAQEAERQRVARELHDATGQSLTGIALGLRGLEGLLTGESPQLIAQLHELQTFSTQALDELRRLIADLWPSVLDDLGLAAALRWYVQGFQGQHAIPTELLLEGKSLRLPAAMETVLFRIAQEALTNIAKYAGAAQVWVVLDTTSTEICLSIQDDGCGFDPQQVLTHADEQTGWGLLGIRERALLLGGRAEIDSIPGHGTMIRVWIPLKGEVHHGEDSLVVGG